MKKIYLETFGCQMNVLDSELVENQLRILGYHFTPSLQDADVILYNTCSVRAKSEQKVWSRLGLLKERKLADPSLVIGVIGCMAERDGASLMKRMPQVDLMCGPSELDQLPQLLDNVLKTGKQQHALAGNTSRRTKTLDHAADGGGEDGLELLDLARSFSPNRGGQNKFQAYIRIVRGCNKFCTYCVVPYTRGPEVSRTPAAILEEAKKLTDAGALEITLLGQTVNHYLHQSPSNNISTPTGPSKSRTTFAELLSLIHDSIPHLPRLRFITSFPADFTDDILHVMNSSPRICRYLHIPAQSGSNRILKLMNRGYTAESYLNLIDRARNIVTSGIQFAGDFIVGFPTETDEDYIATRTLLEKVRYKNSFIFKYSPRPGTLAIKRHPDDVPESTKRHRNNDLLKLQNKICAELNRELIGQTVEVLCEGPSGWSDNEDSPDSVIAAASPIASASPIPNLQSQINNEQSPMNNPPSPLAARLAPYTPHTPTAKKSLTKPLDRHGQPFTRPNFQTSSHTLQLTGRTTHDQITVFHGPAHLAGKILKVTIQDTQGLTLFANLTDDPSVPRPSESAHLALTQ